MNRYRITWIIITIVVFIISIILMKMIISDGNLKDVFSYFGTVTTIMGLIIAIFEVLHAVNTSISIKNIIKKRIEEYEFGDKMWTNSSCIEIIEKIVDAIPDNKYTDAKYMVRDLRKRLNRVCPELLKKEFLYIDNKRITLDQLELNLHSYEKSSYKAPVSKPQLKAISKVLLELRSLLEPQQSVKINKGE